MLVAVTSRKLKIVSYSVTLVCRKMLLSSTMPQKHSAIFDGLLKMKESMIPKFAVNSQRKRKLNPGDTDNAFVLLLLFQIIDLIFRKFI